ncbi:hypothetical protein Ancab_018624 [Ancistrocladus abbreviatus]
MSEVVFVVILHFVFANRWAIVPSACLLLCSSVSVAIPACYWGRLDDLMGSKGGKKKSSSNKSLMYEAPLGYSIEDVRPNGGIKKFRSAAYSNCVRKPS